jgi:hypothetical protein
MLSSLKLNIGSFTPDNGYKNFTYFYINTYKHKLSRPNTTSRTLIFILRENRTGDLCVKVSKDSTTTPNLIINYKTHSNVLKLALLVNKLTFL